MRTPNEGTRYFAVLDLSARMHPIESIQGFSNSIITSRTKGDNEREKAQKSVPHERSVDTIPLDEISYAIKTSSSVSG